MSADVDTGYHSENEAGTSEDKDERRGGQAPHKPLGLWPLVALIFYEVSGGPFGIEDSVVAGGPILALLGFVVLPFIWSVPEALISAELATAFPENSGYVAWVTAAFGPFWGFQEGLWSWLSGVSDNAIYPALFLSYLDELLPQFKDGWYHTISLWAAFLLLTYFNYRGLRIVGSTAVVLTIFTLAPFAVFCCLGAPRFTSSTWHKPQWHEVQWSKYANCLFWNINYWDSASTLAGEVHNPRVTFPKGVFIAVVLVFLSYVLPLLVALGVDGDPRHWKEGYLEHLSRVVGGNWLAIWMVCSSAVSNIGQFEAEMSSDSFQLQGMAERGMLPAVLARKSSHGTPPLAIVLCMLGVGLQMQVSGSLPVLVELLNFMYCLAQLLEFAAFLSLRLHAPHLQRPYRIPLSTAACFVMLLAPTAFIVAIMSCASTRTFIFAGAVVLGGPVLYQLLETARRRQWCEFNDLDYQMFHTRLQHFATAHRDLAPSAPLAAPLLNPLDADLPSNSPPMPDCGLSQ